MKDSFLYQIAQEIVAAHPSDLHKVVVVLPGNRAGVFLRKYLSEIKGEAFLAPRFFIFPEFIQWATDRRTAPSIELTYMLYQAYQTTCGQEAEPFVVFMKWADTALKDFNDADQYLVKGSALFKDLRDYKEIDQWSFNLDPLSQAQEEYLVFWKKLAEIFDAFHRRMHETEKYSYAYLTRLCAEGLWSKKSEEEETVFWFVGLTSFSPAEELVVRKLVDEKRAQVRWDADRFYVEHPFHEAGYFLRKLKRKMPVVLGDVLRHSEKKMVVYESTTAFGQLLGLSEYLTTLTADELRDTAVIIADERLLNVFMHRLPTLPVPVNVALGMRLDRMAVCQLLAALLRLHKRASGKNFFFFPDVAFFFRQTALIPLFQMELSEVVSFIQKKVWRRLGKREWEELVIEFPTLTQLSFVFDQPADGIISMLDVLRKMLVLLRTVETDDKTWQAGWKSMTALLGEWDLLIQRYSFIQDLAAFDTIFKRFTAREQVTFQGDPLNGLQVVNMVESRAVDFRFVCVIGANDDVLPGGLNEQSLVPQDLRSLYGMPTYTEREATYAYTFYRLLHRAEEVRFFYSAVSTDFKGTERSRYITQLMEELPEINSRFTIEEKKINLRADDQAVRADEMENDEVSKQRLKDLLAHGISPSALNRLITCPLDFYFRYIVGMGEEEEMEETISAKTMGTVVHQVLENFFGPRLDRAIEQDEFVAFLNTVPEQLDDALRQHYTGATGELSGYNTLIRSVALRMIESSLQNDKERMVEAQLSGMPLHVHAVEEKLTRQLDVAAHGGTFPIRLQGKADRIDVQGNKWNVIDYKTGKVEAKEVAKKDNDFLDPQQTKAVQLLTYIYLLAGRGIDPTNITAEIVSLANREEECKFMYQKSETIGETELVEFEQQLVALMQSTLEAPKFVHNKASNYCEYCRSIS